MIHGFSEPKRIPRIGKIYLGVKRENNGGKSFPSAVDYFVVRADGGNTSEDAARAFHEVYGPEPREITIAFPSDHPENFMPQYLASYHGGGGRSELWCKGDGLKARRMDGQGGYVEMDCLYQDCPIYQQKKCKPLTRLLFLLPNVEGIGVWELDTTSYFSAQNLGSSVQLIRQLTRGRIAMIPLQLRVIPQSVSPEGTMKTVYVLDLQLTNIKLMELLNRIPTLELAESTQLVEQSDEMPDDLYVESNLVTDKDIQHAPAPAQKAQSRIAPSKNQSNDEPASSVPPEKTNEDVGDNVIGSVAETKIKKTEQGYVGRITVASVTDELIEALTGDVDVLSVLKTVKDGDLVALKTRPSEQWTNKLEIVALELNPAM